MCLVRGTATDGFEIGGGHTPRTDGRCLYLSNAQTACSREDLRMHAFVGRKIKVRVTALWAVRRRRGFSLPPLALFTGHPPLKILGFGHPNNNVLYLLYIHVVSHTSSNTTCCCEPQAKSTTGHLSSTLQIFLPTRAQPISTNPSAALRVNSDW